MLLLTLLAQLSMSPFLLEDLRFDSNPIFDHVMKNRALIGAWVKRDYSYFHHCNRLQFNQNVIRFKSWFGCDWLTSFFIRFSNIGHVITNWKVIGGRVLRSASMINDMLSKAYIYYFDVLIFFIVSFYKVPNMIYRHCVSFYFD